MLTPIFQISQDDEYIIIEMKCPYIKAQSVEIDVNDKEFRFYGKPYFLRLHFTHSLIENGREKSSYNTDTGILLLHIPKAEKGQHFEDLDLLTKLMDIKEKPVEKKVLIEEIGDSKMEPMSDMAIDNTEQEEFDWNHPQELPVIQTSTNYGFNNLYSGMGASINELARDFIDIKDLDSSTYETRRNERLTIEELKFDDEYYMYDCVMNEDIPMLLEFKPDSWKLLKKVQKLQEIQVELDQGELEQLSKLSNKNYLFAANEEIYIYFGLIDIIYAYCYNYRTTLGEDTVESAWTICKLSGTLSCFETFTSLNDVLKCCLRRSISFPLYRSFELSQKAHESMYLIDRVYITDYCIWIQKASDRQLKSLASELNHFEFKRELSDWELEDLEKAAKESKEELK
ncbi:Hsp90 cochaperone shq1 [Boothiomyces macroporosus]|uniref:Hsp90 cochaperone shq1 n=1 Tax=Boothiomyces macroporosus TaxID=261099 RepID=A0AAD5UMK2_9FUNG|nr:Hsp90 cochaperone shq1 [Boothiomyces macroporosus]